MIEYIDFMSKGYTGPGFEEYIPHLYIRRSEILSISGLEPPECIHTFATTPTVDGAQHNSARFDQRRISIAFTLPKKYYLASNANATNGKFSVMSDNLVELRRLDYKGAGKLEVKTVDNSGTAYSYYLYNTRIERMSYPTIDDSAKVVVIDLVSEESYFCGDKIIEAIKTNTADVRLLSPGATRGDGVLVRVKLTGSTATQIGLEMQKLKGGRDEMLINVEAGSNRTLVVDTRFKQKSIMLGDVNYINNLLYESQWLKSDCATPNVFATPGATAADANYYVDYDHSTFEYEPAFLGVEL